MTNPPKYPVIQKKTDGVMSTKKAIKQIIKIKKFKKKYYRNRIR
jgi:hypothetical protein